MFNGEQNSLYIPSLLFLTMVVLSKTNRRAQAAAGAAVLLAIIAAVIVAYVILIPPQERQQLLGEGGPSASGVSTAVSSSSGSVAGQNLLTAAPGKIDFLSQKDLEHTLPDISLQTKTDSKVLGEKASIYAKKGIFSEKKSDFSFTVSDIGNTENILLAYTPKIVDGNMVVVLNGEEIFNGVVNVKSPKPILLSKNLLKADNVLEFAEASPGLAFWRTNELSLEDVRVLGDVTNLEAQVSKSIFSVSDVEKRNMDKAILKFQLDCSEGDAGQLLIMLNANEVYSGVPDCNQPALSFEISPNLIYENQNVLLLKTNRGSFALSHPRVISKLKEISFPSYYFQLSLEQFGSVKASKKKVYLTVDFTDASTQKTGQLEINGHVNGFDTKEGKLALEITNYVVQGNNAIVIKPAKTFDVRELKVDFVS